MWSIYYNSTEIVHAIPDWVMTVSVSALALSFYAIGAVTEAVVHRWRAR